MDKDNTIALSDAIVALSKAGLKVQLDTDSYQRQWLCYSSAEMNGRIRVTVNAAGRNAGKRVKRTDLPCPVEA
jgi:hypothetical protein